MSEALGIFMLTFIGAGSIIMANLSMNPAPLLLIALAHGIALSIGVSATMNVSGGHLNPAVTIAMFITKRIERLDAIAYIGAQILGSMFAAALLLLAISQVPGGAEAIDRCNLGTPGPGRPDTAWITVVLLEGIMTFLLGFAIFGTAVDPRAPKIGGWGIGLAVAGCILVGGPITGAAMNPARVLGPALMDASWALHWCYWVGPTLGMLMAALVYDNLIMEKE